MTCLGCLELFFPLAKRVAFTAPVRGQCELFQVRAVLAREKAGYTLNLLRRGQLPDALSYVKKLRMHECLSSTEVAGALDRAEHTRTPGGVVIRAGRELGDEQLTVANNVRFVK